MKVSYCSKTDLGTKYPVNTDALGDKSTRNGHVFVVADGQPFDQNGSFVSKLAVQSVLDFFDKEQFDNIYIGINHAFQFVNEQVYRATISNENLKGAYVSLALVLVRPEGAYYGHVGNARVAIQSDDQLTLLTKDHGFLDVQPYQVGSSSSRIVKAIGNTPSVYPTVCNEPILGTQGDVILLATNGLFKSFNLDQLNESFDYSTINKDIVSLVDKAKGSGSAENLTLQLIAVTEGNRVKSISQARVTTNTIKADHSSEEIKNNMFNLAGMERKRIIQVGAILIAFFLVIWFVFRTPKDDTDLVLDDAGEVVKADTTNPNQDLESMMEYDTPKEKVEEEKVEEEEEESNTETEEETDSQEEEQSADSEVKTEASPNEPKKEEKKETKKEESKSSKGGSHVVKSGDNLGKIAEKYHVKIDALKKANNIKDDQINIGQELKIPN
jgi:serine/threonine protein phosphatase PrpC/LysM repeat protein